METALGLVEIAVKLFNLLDVSYEQGKGLAAGIDFIRRELQSIKEVISMRSGTADQEGIRSWMADLRDIHWKIENCVDLYNLRVVVVGGEHKKKPGVVRDAIHHLRTTIARGKLSDDIEAIKKLVAQANSRVTAYHPQAQQATIHKNSSTVNNGATRHASEAHPDGLDTPKAELVRLLAQGDGKAKQLRVIAIDGLGGSGKTVLAKVSYEQVNREFDCRAWVSASDDVDQLLADILREFSEQIPQSSKDLGRRLRDFLENKRYIIVIDNVHTTVWWRDILYACPDNNMSSRIIVTTANEQIARNCHMNCRIQKMQPLDHISARVLLTRKAFGDDGCPINLEENLDMILKTCECLPLAIVNMADHIKGKRLFHRSQCVQACENLRFLLDAKNEAFLGMHQVLDRSYNSLNNHAMACLLSLTMYHKDNVFKRKSLIRRWLAERVIIVTDGQSEEVVANQCFTDLVDHNIILPTDVSINGQVKRFRVHRIMFEFIINKAHSENCVKWISIHEDGMTRDWGHGENINRLILHNNSSRPPRIGEKLDLSCVRSLTCFGLASKSLMYFKDYTLLRSLDLEGCSNLHDEHLETLCKSSMLRYLSIRGNAGVSKIPRKMIKLKHLETLDTRGTSVGTLPMEIIQLPELTNLFGLFQIIYSSSSMKAFLSEKICRLQTLAGFFVDESSYFVKALPRMPKLNKVKISCRETAAPSNEVITDLLISLKECFEKDLSPRHLPLRSLSIDFGSSGNLDFLDKLEVPFPCSLQSLKLRGKLTRLPKFIESANLQELCLSGSNLGWDVLSRLQCLQNLLYLKLTEQEPSAFKLGAEGFVWRSGGFVNLKRLCLVVAELPRIVIQHKAMPGLESLQLFCFWLGAISGIEHLLRLEEVVVASSFRGVAAEDLKRQVEAHPVRPKFVEKPHPSPPASRRELTRSIRIQRTDNERD